MTLFNLKYLLETLSPNTVTLGNTVSTYEVTKFGVGHVSVHSTKQGRLNNLLWVPVHKVILFPFDQNSFFD